MPADSFGVLVEGTIIGHKLRIDGLLGRGGFGITYRGFDISLDRRVAIKELYPPGCRRDGSVVIGTESIDFPGARSRFLAEGRNLAKFNHDGIVRVLDIIEENNTAYLVMAYLDGENLADRILRIQRLSSDETRRIISEVASALDAVHAVGMLHRDVKPSNIILTTRQAVLVDFGSSREIAGDKSQHLTRLLSPGYAAPEQYSERARYGPWTDIYGLGATAFHALTGEPPTPTLDRVGGDELIPVRTLAPNAADDLVNLIDRCLQLNPTNRPQHVRDLQLSAVGPREQSPAAQTVLFDGHDPSLGGATTSTSLTGGAIVPPRLEVVPVVEQFVQAGDEQTIIAAAVDETRNASALSAPAGGAAIDGVALPGKRSAPAVGAEIDGVSSPGKRRKSLLVAGGTAGVALIGAFAIFGRTHPDPVKPFALDGSVSTTTIGVSALTSLASGSTDEVTLATTVSPTQPPITSAVNTEILSTEIPSTAVSLTELQAVETTPGPVTAVTTAASPTVAPLTVAPTIVTVPSRQNVTVLVLGPPGQSAKRALNSGAMRAIQLAKLEASKDPGASLIAPNVVLSDVTKTSDPNVLAAISLGQSEAARSRVQFFAGFPLLVADGTSDGIAISGSGVVFAPPTDSELAQAAGKEAINRGTKTAVVISDDSLQAQIRAKAFTDTLLAANVTVRTIVLDAANAKSSAAQWAPGETLFVASTTSTLWSKFVIAGRVSNPEALIVGIDGLLDVNTFAFNKLMKGAVFVSSLPTLADESDFTNRLKAAGLPKSTDPYDERAYRSAKLIFDAAARSSSSAPITRESLLQAIREIRTAPVGRVYVSDGTSWN
jgi:serine/threonine protein kinase